MKPLFLALVLIPSAAGLAHSAKLVNGPLDPVLGGNAEAYNRFVCSARFVGDGPGPVSVTIRAFAGAEALGTRTLKLSRAAPAGNLTGLCGDAFGTEGSCRQFVCVINSPAPAADLRGSACIGSGSTVPVCLEAR